MKKILIAVVMVLLLVAGGWVAVRHSQQTTLNQADQAMAKQEFAKARVMLERNRWLPLSAQDQWRHDHLLAMAYLNDPELDATISGEKAIPLLESIPPQSQQFADAQVSLAKHWFLLYAMPKKAERLLKQGLGKEPDHLEAKDLLFSIYAATNNPVKADKIFWEAFPDAPENEKLTRFQQWFCSQFTRNAANAKLDQFLGFADPRGEEFSVFNRLVRFKDQEPDESQHFGALAEWWLSQNETKIAIEVLAKGREVAGNFANVRYFGSYTDSLIRQGEFELATRTLKSWPEDERHFKYWRTIGVIRQNAGDYRQAVDAYQESTKYWPSNLDPDLYYRINVCYTELGMPEKATEALEHSNRIRLWMEEKWPLVHKGMAEMGIHPEAVQLLIQFFTAIERPEAVAYLQQQLKRLESEPEAAKQGAENDGEGI